VRTVIFRCQIAAAVWQLPFWLSAPEHATYWASFLHAALLRCLQSKPKGDWVAGELSTHYKGDTWQANLTAVNPKASTGEGIGSVTCTPFSPPLSLPLLCRHLVASLEVFQGAT
jgi:hypothetical protein